MNHTQPKIKATCSERSRSNRSLERPRSSERPSLRSNILLLSAN